MHSQHATYVVPCCECGRLQACGKGTAARYGRGECCVVCEVCLVLARADHAHRDGVKVPEGTERSEA